MLCTLRQSKFQGSCEFRDIFGKVWDSFQIEVPEKIVMDYSSQAVLNPDTISIVSSNVEKEVLEFGKQRHYLRFYEELGPDVTISNCRLQIMLSNAKRRRITSGIEIRIESISKHRIKVHQQPLITQSKAAMTKIDEFEHGEVYVSPILDDIIRLETRGNIVDITLLISGDDQGVNDVGFFGFHSELKSCVSPTLFCKLEH